MSKYEIKDNTGAIFKNTRKENDNHADYRGEARINGHDVWVNAWINKDKNGNSYMKLGFKKKDGTASRPERPVSNDRPVMDNTKAGSWGDLGDDVPFHAEFR